MKSYLIAVVVTIFILELVIFLVLDLLGRKHLEPEKLSKIKKKFRLQGYLGISISLILMYLVSK